MTIAGRAVMKKSYEVFEDWVSISTVQLWNPAGGRPTATLTKGAVVSAPR